MSQKFILFLNNLLTTNFSGRVGTEYPRSFDHLDNLCSIFQLHYFKVVLTSLRNVTEVFTIYIIYKKEIVLRREWEFVTPATTRSLCQDQVGVRGAREGQQNWDCTQSQSSSSFNDNTGLQPKNAEVWPIKPDRYYL